MKVAAFGTFPGLPGRSQGSDSPGFFTQDTLKGWLPDILERKNLHDVADWYLPQFYYHSERDHWLPFLFLATFGLFAETLRGRFERFLTLKFIASGTIWKFSASPLNSEKPGKCRTEEALPEAATFTHSF